MLNHNNKCQWCSFKDLKLTWLDTSFSIIDGGGGICDILKAHC